MRIAQALEQFGIDAFGWAMPRLSPEWTSGALPTVPEATLALTLESGTWRAPLAGTLRVVRGSAPGVTLVGARGAMASGPGLLLTLYPTPYLRLKRLYAQELERATGARPERDRGLPFRPVPRYFLYRETPGSDARGGHIDPRADLGLGGELTMYDEQGMILDPLAVASVFQHLMVQHPLLQYRGLEDPFVTNTQVKQLSELAGTPAVVRLRLADPAGSPYDGSHLEGLTEVDAGSGLFNLEASGGGGSDLSGSVRKEDSTDVDGAFPPNEHRLLKFGPATTGRLTGGPLSLPQLPSGVTLPRDFFTLQVVRLQGYLLGTPNPDYDGTKVENPPTVRIHEPVGLLADGNDVLGAAEQALTGASEESIAVAQVINGGFDAPPEPGEDAHWPAFPPTSASPADAGPLPVDLREGFEPRAHFFDDGDSATANVDVILSLSGLPAEAAVRVYNRRFISDAREARGNGAGGVAAADGTLTLRLKDPLGLRRPGLPDSAITLPSQATLRFDVMVLKRTGEARLYGNVSCPIDAPSTEGAPAGGTNLFATAARRSESNSGVLGLSRRDESLPTGTLDAVLALAGEGNPRFAPRLPTMARRELLVAGLASSTSGAWRSVLASGRLAPETHSARPRLGAPGGPGGRETQVVGVSTQNGRLAYDIARMGMRRATNIVTRLEQLADGRWDEPDEPSELATDAEPTESAGTFAGAVLQTIAPFCETPELNALAALVDPDSTSRPTTFDELVDWVAANLVPGGIPFRTQIISALNSLKDNDTLSESDKERLFNELEREIMSSRWGRRDAQWALRDAIGRARRFIYIESPGFGRTQKGYGDDPVPPYAADLLQTLANRLNEATGLRVIICTPKHPDFAAGYEPMTAHEVEERRSAILGLPTATDPHPHASRVVAFHPVGFPGRPSRLETTVVIIDDVWALVGSSTFRRRGLTFDGGSDVVLTDTDRVGGVSPALQRFRRELMASRLGLGRGEVEGGVVRPEPNFVRLADGVEAFSVVRELLLAGGLGKVERLWNGQNPWVEPPPPESVSFDLASPEGHEFDLAAALAVSTLADLNSY